MEKTQKEFFLREQLKAVQEELDDTEGNKSEIDQLKEKIEAANMPENVNAVALKELSRYEKIPQNSPESSIIRSEEHTSELQSRGHLVCRLLLEKKKKKTNK